MNKELLQTYVNEKMSIRKIAKKENLSYTTVRYYLNKYGLSTGKVKVHWCKTCGEENPENFYGKQKEACKKCFNKSVTNSMKKNKEKWVMYKGGACLKCGYNRSLSALEFHHVEPSKKDPNFIRIRGWSEDRAKRELDKCILVCANCHREIHSIDSND